MIRFLNPYFDRGPYWYEMFGFDDQIKIVQ
jgi:hypothetical protein